MTSGARAKRWATRAFTDGARAGTLPLLPQLDNEPPRTSRPFRRSPLGPVRAIVNRRRRTFVHCSHSQGTLFDALHAAEWAAVTAKGRKGLIAPRPTGTSDLRRSSVGLSGALERRSLAERAGHLTLAQTTRGLIVQGEMARKVKVSSCRTGGGAQDERRGDRLSRGPSGAGSLGKCRAWLLAGRPRNVELVVKLLEQRSQAERASRGRATSGAADAARAGPTASRPLRNPAQLASTTLFLPLAPSPPRLPCGNEALTTHTEWGTRRDWQQTRRTTWDSSLAPPLSLHSTPFSRPHRPTHALDQYAGSAWTPRP